MQKTDRPGGRILKDGFIPQQIKTSIRRQYRMLVCLCSITTQCTESVRIIAPSRNGKYDVKEGFILPIHHDCGSFVVNGSGYDERKKPSS